MNKSPCLDCKYRDLYCHMNCESYSEYKKKQETINENRRYGADTTSYTINTIRKFKKARNLPQYR